MATNPAPRFTPAATLEDDLRRGYERATSFSPIKTDERDKVYKTYGLKAGVSKGKSDRDLEHLAATSAINVFKKTKADAAAAAKKAAAPKPAKPAPAGPRPAAKPAAKPAPVKPTAVSSAYVKKQMAAHGFKTAPPAYALSSQAAFDAWLARAVAYANRPRSTTIKDVQAIKRVQGADIGPVQYSGPKTTATAPKPIRRGGFHA